MSRLLPVAARLTIMAGTSYFLIATSSPEPGPPTTPPGSTMQSCWHPAESLTFHVTGTCGGEGDITVMSDANDCTIAISGATAVGLPSAGRFDGTGSQTVSLLESSWRISGYLPEGTASPGPFTVVRSDAGPWGMPPDGSGHDAGIFVIAADGGPSMAPDAGIFTVPADGGATSIAPDAGVFTVSSPDASPDLRVPPGTGGAGGTITAHGSLISRSCTHPSAYGLQSLSCTDDSGRACQVSLTSRN